MITFVRNAHASICGIRGPRAEVEAAQRVITERAERFGARLPAHGLIVLVDPAPTARWGACLSCGDAMAPHRGGQCELCEAALGKALRSGT